MTAPMGYLADLWGTRSVLMMNVSATATLLLWIALVGHLRAVFPTEALLVGPFLTLYGGGSCVLKSVTLALVAEIAPHEAQR